MCSRTVLEENSRRWDENQNHFEGTSRAVGLIDSRSGEVAEKSEPEPFWRKSMTLNEIKG